MAQRLVAVSCRLSLPWECLFTFPTLARKLKACHLMRRWGLCAALTRATPPPLRGSGESLSTTRRAQRTNPAGLWGVWIRAFQIVDCALQVDRQAFFADSRKIPDADWTIPDMKDPGFDRVEVGQSCIEADYLSGSQLKTSTTEYLERQGDQTSDQIV